MSHKKKQRKVHLDDQEMIVYQVVHTYQRLYGEPIPFYLLTMACGFLETKGVVVSGDTRLRPSLAVGGNGLMEIIRELETKVILLFGENKRHITTVLVNPLVKAENEIDKKAQEIIEEFFSQVDQHGAKRTIMKAYNVSKKEVKSFITRGFPPKNPYSIKKGGMKDGD